MNLSSEHLGALQDGNQWAMLLAPSPLSFLVGAIVIILITSYTWSSSTDTTKGLPNLNPPGFFSSVEAKKFFLRSGGSLVAQARKLYPGQAYRVMTNIGERVIVPHELLEEVRNERRLHFGHGFVEDGGFDGRVPGFEPFMILTQNEIFPTVIKKYMTKIPPTMSKSICDEAEFIIPRTIGDSIDWHEMALSPVVLEIVTKVAVRVFLGTEFSRNEDWVRVTQGFTHSWAIEASKLHLWPRPLRMLIHWILPGCRAARSQVNEARRMLAPVIAKRQAMTQAAIAAGHDVPRFDDSIEWIAEEAARRGVAYDTAMVVNFQLILTLVAIHTTTDSLQQFLVDLAQNPESFQQIRQEVIGQLQAGGLSKDSFHKMPLLDSAMKETQRLKPIQFLMMRRRAQADIKFSNGLHLKKGTRIWADTCRMRDPAVYENPDEWDAARFLRLRSQPSKASEAHLISLSPDHLGFGYGIHACPGRFFAVHELKVLLCHLLVKYEWTLAPGTDVTPMYLGETCFANPETKVMIRRREEPEYDFSSI
ncbi:cytochrome P450 [Hypoxylon cercidicola]|nr:cytochrome P450 [Hypoxylon cercidicola]